MVQSRTEHHSRSASVALSHNMAHGSATKGKAPRGVTRQSHSIEMKQDQEVRKHASTAIDGVNRTHGRSRPAGRRLSNGRTRPIQAAWTALATFTGVDRHLGGLHEEKRRAHSDERTAKERHPPWPPALLRRDDTHFGQPHLAGTAAVEEAPDHTRCGVHRQRRRRPPARAP